jgi:hypothetical protein
MFIAISDWQHQIDKTIFSCPAHAVLAMTPSIDKNAPFHADFLSYLSNRNQSLTGLTFARIINTHFCRVSGSSGSHLRNISIRITTHGFINAILE